MFNLDSDGSEKDYSLLDDPVATLNTIANDIKQRVPVNDILPSENIKIPKPGEVLTYILKNQVL